MATHFIDYTPEEWAKIDECVAGAPGKPSWRTGLLKDERLRLLKAARAYQRAIADRANGIYAPTNKRRSFFKKLKGELVRLHQTLETAANLFGTNWRETEFVW